MVRLTWIHLLQRNSELRAAVYPPGTPSVLRPLERPTERPAARRAFQCVPELLDVATGAATWAAEAAL